MIQTLILFHLKLLFFLSSVLFQAWKSTVGERGSCGQLLFLFSVSLLPHQLLLLAFAELKREVEQVRWGKALNGMVVTSIGALRSGE